ncbi:MAG: ISAs1 family transposase [Acidithiobacillus sp.]
MYKRLVEHFSLLQDPRQTGKVVYRLLDILVTAICAVIAGAETWEDMALYAQEKHDWLATFLDLPQSTPSHDTFRRVFSIVDPDAVERCFQDWVAGFSPEEREVIAIDGKAVRRSFTAGAKHHPLHLLSAFATRRGLSLGQRIVDGKSNEITAIPALLDTLQVQGGIVTIDAMGCQRTIAQKILDRGADYLLALKGNQKGMQRAVESYAQSHCFGGAGSRRADMDTGDQGHGRWVRRRIFALPEACALPELQDWPGLRQVLAVETIRQLSHNPGTRCEIRYYLSSCADPVEVQARAIREHWGIENRLHWVLDMTFREDESRVRERNGARCLAILRKIALNLIRQDAIHKGSLRGKRKKAGWSNAYMAQVVFGEFHA